MKEYERISVEIILINDEIVKTSPNYDGSENEWTAPDESW